MNFCALTTAKLQTIRSHGLSTYLTSHIQVSGNTEVSRKGILLISGITDKVETEFTGNTGWLKLQHLLHYVMFLGVLSIDQET